MQTGNSNYIPTLDGWRAIAIIGVLICHGAGFVFDANGSFPNSQLYHITRYGALGVNLFFGISGFLICTRLLREQENYKQISIRNFYIRRAFRILPAYLFYLLVLTLLSALGWFQLYRKDLLSCVFFFRNYVVGGWYTGHFWSLAVEEHFYLLLPVTLVLFGLRRSRIMVVLLALAVAVWRVIEFRHGLISRHLPRDVSFYSRTDICMDALLWGCATAFLFQQSIWRERVGHWITPWAWCLLAILYIYCVAANPPLTMMWQAMLIPVLLVGTVLNPSWWLGKFLELPFIRWVGRISYGLYLWQQLFLPSDKSVVISQIKHLQQFPFNILAIFICATLSYYLMERHLIKIGHRLAARFSKAENRMKSSAPVLSVESADS